MSSNSIANELHAFATAILPFNRSLTGEGVFKTLTFIQSFLPNLRIHSVKSGTKVFDWVVPKEWSVKQAYIIRPDGKRICDFSECNLHLVGYSALPGDNGPCQVARPFTFFARSTKRGALCNILLQPKLLGLLH